MTNIYWELPMYQVLNKLVCVNSFNSCNNAVRQRGYREKYSFEYEIHWRGEW